MHPKTNPGPLPRILAAVLVVSLTASVGAWDGSPAPHDDAYLVLIRHDDFTGPGGEETEVVRDGDSPFARAVEFGGRLLGRVRVQHAGRYHAWIHLSGADGGRSVRCELRDGDETVVRGRLGRDEGAPGKGGPAGFAAYLEKAIENTRDGAVRARSLGYDVEGGEAILGAPAQEDAGGLLEDLTAPEGSPYLNVSRVEKRGQKRRYLWWKMFSAELEPGSYELFLDPGTGESPAPLRLDAAFLSTAPEYAKLYPYAGDFNYPRGTYVRFRIDRLGDDGNLMISVGMQIHHAPFSVSGVRLARNGLFDRKTEGTPQPHERTGFTRWYRLQDAENVPGGGNVGMRIGLSETAGVAGDTRFADAPHRDATLRSFDWQEVDGRKISMDMRVRTHLHKLRTFRDHERLHYRWALDATGEVLSPLARGNLIFSNASGGATGGAEDYMFKVLRLLGINAAATRRPRLYHRLYGAEAQGGHYWPPGWLPYDRQATRKRYDRHYREFFGDRAKQFEIYRVFQLADEPGEINREAMSAPEWRYVEVDDEGRIRDACGGSRLHTRKTDYQDCVLEGRFRLLGGRLFGLRVAHRNPEEPGGFGFWQLGVYGNPRYQKNNILYGVGPGRGTGKKITGASVRSGIHHFKIIYQKTRAALYVDGRPMPVLKGLAPEGGFGIFGGPRKEVWDLRFRPIRREERLLSGPDEAGAQLIGDGEDGDLLGAEDIIEDEREVPEWARPKPLRQAFEEDWIQAGGIPAAQEGFRRWAAERGLGPGTFGADSWAEVTMLTLPALVRNDHERRLYYWSRRYSGLLTPRMFAMAGAALHRHAPNPHMKSYTALSGHGLYMRGPTMPLDMFHLAGESAGTNMMPGVSDWMTSSWNWDSHQAVAYSVAPYNSGARRYGAPPAGYPMMHCGWPSELRSYTMLANNVKCISYFWYGPIYAGTEWMWSESRRSYRAVSDTANRAARIEDIAGPGAMRPSRVALLYSRATEYWNPASSFADKRATFLSLSHRYFQPELLTDRQIIQHDVLRHYDALFVLEPNVRRPAQERIARWVRHGGLLWTAADALSRDEYDQKSDLLAELARLRRLPPQEGKTDSDREDMTPAEGEEPFAAHPVRARWTERVRWDGATVRARYDDGSPAWLEKPVGDGRLVYLGHRPGLTGSANAKRQGSRYLWAEAPRRPLVRPLLEADIERPLILSRPAVMASPLSTENGTAIVLFNLTWKPVKDLEVGLTEPGEPHSVRMFDNLALRPADWEYREGRVWIEVPELDVHRGQIILVRRRPAPEDGRLERMRARTARQLESEQWRALSAGAWFAGFYPRWNLAPKLTPLLEHSSWAVRRAAAESVGRLRHRPASESLLAAACGETDPHALADQILALARLGRPETPALCETTLRDADRVIPRRAALRALRMLIEQTDEPPPLLTERARRAVKTLSDHPDRRLSGAAEELSQTLPAAGQ